MIKLRKTTRELATQCGRFDDYIRYKDLSAENYLLKEKIKKLKEKIKELKEKIKEKIKELKEKIKELNNEAQRYYEDAYCNNYQNEKNNAYINRQIDNIISELYYNMVILNKELKYSSIEKIIREYKKI